MAGMQELEALAAEFAAGPILIHSDVMKAASFVGEYRGKEAFLESHWKILERIAGDRPLWFPCFNYDFVQTGQFDVRHCPSQVGALSEFIRCNHADWRNEVPVYSIAGTGSAPTAVKQDVLYPFGKNSAFEELLAQDGQLLFYGSAYVNTFGHYLEQLGNNLPYRYPKQFQGQLTTTSGQSRSITVEYHCRPLGYPFAYDVDYILEDLHQEGIAHFLEPNDQTVISIQTRALADYWLTRFQEDPYFLLTAETKHWVVEKVQQLGHPFCLADFEPVEETRAAG